MKTHKNYRNEMFMILKTSRVETSFISGILTSLIILTHSDSQLLQGFLRGLPIIFVTMIGFILNDIYDYEKDKASKKNRPICTDRLKVKATLKWIILISILASVIDILYKDYTSLLVIMFTIVGVAFYSPFSRRIPLFKGFYTALLCCAPLIYGLTIVRYPINFYYLIPIVIFVIGRELMLDVFDLAGDSIYKLKTIPIYLGKWLSLNLSWLCMYLGSYILFVMAHNPAGNIFSALSLLTIMSAYLLIYRKSNAFFEITTRIALLIGSVAITFIA